jgi:hypothetical protein
VALATLVEHIELRYDNGRTPQAIGFVKGDVADIATTPRRIACYHFRPCQEAWSMRHGRGFLALEWIIAL